MKKDQDKKKEQPITELGKMRQRPAKLEVADTDGKRTGEKIQQQTGFLNTILDSLPYPFYVIDVNDYTIKMANPAAKLGKFSENSTCYALTHHRDKPCRGEHGCPLQEVKKTRKPVVTEHIHYGEDGNARDVEVHGYPIFDSEGNVIQIIECAFDITERKQAEKKLRESEERYHALVSLGGEVGEAIVMLQNTEQGEAIQTFISDQWPRITGYSREELLGMPFFELIQPKYRKASLKRHRRKMSGESIPELFEMSIIRKDGTEVPIELTSAYTTYQGRTANVAFIRDITDRKQMEYNLQERIKELKCLYGIADVAERPDITPDELYQEVVNLMPSSWQYPMIACARITIGNKEFKTKYYRDTKLKQSSDIKVYGAKAGTVEVGYLEESPELDEGPFLKEERFLIDAVAERLGQIIEHKQAEEALRKSEIKYRTLVENIPQKIFYKDRNSVYISCNNNYARDLKIKPEEITGRTDYEFYPKELAEKYRADDRRIIELEEAESIEESYIQDGQARIVQTYKTPVKDNEGNVVGVLGIFHDITESKRAEEREKQLQQELIATSRLATVGEMAAGIAHEINNPLTGVIGFSELLMKEDIPEDIRKGVNIIYDGAQRIANITGRMLSYTHQYKPERTSVNVNDIIETTLALRAYEMESSNIEVATQLNPDLPITVADAGQLQQVFLNIILNAETEMILAHNGGNLTIRTERIDNTIRASFRDDGPGIAKENLDKIFNPFFTTREVGKGAGLGLSVCHGIVTQHSGKIYARSILGKGATFIVELPVVTKEEQLKMAEPAAEVSKTLSRARILVVDDDMIVQQFLNEILTEEGHEVEIVENGDDALDRLGSEDYDVILLDIKLPGKSGIEIYKQLQKNSKPLARKVIFITGDVMEKDTMDFLARASTPYITKPFDVKQLKKDINRIISQ